MTDRVLNEGLEYLNKEYISLIMRYLTTGVFEVPQGGSMMKAHTVVWELGNRDLTKSPQALFKLFTDTIRSYYMDIAIPRIAEKTGKEMISEFSLHWQNFTILTYWLVKPFQFLERDFLRQKEFQKKRATTLSQIALNLFQSEAFQAIIKIIVKNLFDQLEAERTGELIDWVKLKKALQCFRVMGMRRAEVRQDGKGGLVWNGIYSFYHYKTYFEKEYITQTTNFYIEESKKWISTMSTPEYVRVVRDSIKKEEEKVLNFLDKDTRPILIKNLDKELIENYSEILVKKDKTGVVDMLSNNRRGELKEIYDLLYRVPGMTNFILEKFGPYILSRGQALKETKELIEDPILYMTKLVDLKKEMDSIILECFRNAEEFLKSNDSSFIEIMDNFELTPKFMANYIDYLMRQGLRGKEAETENIIDNVFGLFKLLKPKDAFTEHNKELYALRLLQHTSISDTAEEMLISKMKVELGAQHVSKYVQMGVDMKNSRDQTDEFRKQDHGGVIGGVDISVKVLTSGLWGNEHNTNCILPKDLKSCCERFEHYYKTIHTGRHLVWNAGLGDCEVSAVKFKKPYTFILNVYQTSILLLFNDNIKYTYKELQEYTKLPPDVLNKQLFNLTNPKLGKLLIKANLKTPKFTESELITLNMNFAAPSLRMSLIPIPPRKKTVDEHKKECDEEMKEINRQRAAILQATIVKIMKGRRQENHNELITEVIKQVQAFRPEPMMIKSQIEYLIESDYLMRDTNDKGKYIYKP